MKFLENNLSIDEHEEELLKFNKKYSDLIEEVKNIFYINLNDNEKYMFIDIIDDNNYYEEENEKQYEEENIEIIDNISKEEIVEELIKEYISISMIKTNNNSKIILFIPTENVEIKKKVIDHIKKRHKEEILPNIIFGDLDFYNINEDQ